MTIKRILSQFFLKRNRPEWFVQDTCGRVCAYITWMLIFWGQFVVFYVIIPPWFHSDKIFTNQLYLESQNNPEDRLRNLNYEEHLSSKNTEIISSSIYAFLNGCLFFMLGLFAFTAHVKAMFSDPGTTQLNNADPESIAAMNLPSGTSVYKCTKCSAIKPSRAHHCSTCRRCVKKMDHHCPWINNCVGENNQKYFVLFTFYICGISLHALVMILHRFMVCSNTGWKNQMCTVRSPGFTIMSLVSLTFEACLFFLFTAIMFCTQVYAICVDETGIEQMKGDLIQSKNGGATQKSKMLNFKSVFGDKFSFRWLIPFVDPVWAKSDMSLYCV